MAWSPDGRQIAAGGDNGETWVWEVSTSRQLFKLGGHTDWVRGVAWSPDGNWIATASDDATAQVFNARTGMAIAKLQSHTDYVRDVLWSPDGRRLLTVSDDRRGILWETANWTESMTLQSQTDKWLMSAAWSSDGATILTGDTDGWVRVWNAETGQETGAYPLGGRENTIRCLIFAPGSNRFSAALDAVKLSIWDTAGATISGWDCPKVEE